MAYRRESYLRMLIGKAMKYDILMDEDSKIDINSDDFDGEIYRGLTGKELIIPNDKVILSGVQFSSIVKLNIRLMRLL